MTYKEALFFIGKCLTINHENHNKILVEDTLKKDLIDWEAIVKVSTKHYVFPALYCNLKKAKFLHYLPEDLVGYMQHITDLNRERNEQIITQAKEINEILLANNITPIFLKGTGNLLEGLYDDIAERMVGDIDFLVADEDCKKAFNILLQHGYNEFAEIYDEHRHLSRLVHPNKVGAIEIHREMLRKDKSKYFNFKKVKDSFLKRNNFNFLSINNQIKLTVFSKFVNDDAYLLKSVGLRPAYDCLCLANKTNDFVLIPESENLSKELHAALLLYKTILNSTELLNFPFSSSSKIYTKKVIETLNESRGKKSLKIILAIKHRFIIIFNALFKKSYFRFIYKKLTDRNWYKRRFGI